MDVLLEHLDINRVLARVDMNALLANADLDELIARVDIEAVISRIDIDQVVAKVDIDAVLQRVDIDALLEHTELGSLIARSGSAVMGQVLDVARAQGVGMDSFIHRWSDRLFRRDPSTRPGGPPLLVSPPAAV